jgi:hypothetical protein
VVVVVVVWWSPRRSRGRWFPEVVVVRCAVGEVCCVLVKNVCCVSIKINVRITNQNQKLHTTQLKCGESDAVKHLKCVDVDFDSHFDQPQLSHW